MFILKDKYIKRGWFSLDMAGYQNGAIGVVLKYVDTNNYYLFEIGGYLEENRYFELRKKTNGMMKPVMRINSNDEIEPNERRKSSDFGYYPYKWYSIRVLVNGPTMKFFYKKVGGHEKLVMTVRDDDIPYGLIGLTTFNTKGVFDNLIMRPKVEEKKFSFIPSDLPMGMNPEEDVYLYYEKDKAGGDGDDGDEPNKKYLNQDTPSPPPKKGANRGGPGGPAKGDKSGATGGYMSCLKKRTPTQRKKFCKDGYGGIPGLRQKCENDYCNFCCDKNVPWIQRNHLFTCKRQCNILSVKEKKGDWKANCISVAKPNFSIYAYCDDHFQGYTKATVCKLDTCRVCCVVTDQMTKKKDSVENLERCFQACAETFIMNPNREDS